MIISSILKQLFVFYGNAYMHRFGLMSKINLIKNVSSAKADELSLYTPKIAFIISVKYIITKISTLSGRGKPLKTDRRMRFRTYPPGYSK